MNLSTNHMARPLTLGIVAILFLIALFFTLSPSVAEPAPQADIEYRGNQLVRPEGYREWIYVGTPLTPNDMNPPEAPFPDFHNVYIHSDDLAYYKRTGEFPDGTMLVKELVSVGSKAAVSGQGYFMGEFIGLEATIKDSTRFPNEPGNWAYFSFGHEYPLADTAEPFPTAACNACHQASAADDFVFTQYYPILRAAKTSRSTGAAMTSGSAQFEAMTAAMSGALDAGMEATAPTGAAPGGVPTEDSALLAYLRAGTYKQMPHKEQGTHASSGPHKTFGRPVTVFMNETLAASLAAGNEQHPAGSQAVKEMYLPGGSELEGWAVMVKTQDNSAGGKGWYWYEVTSTESGSEPVASGNGVPMCFRLPCIGKRLRSYPMAPAIARGLCQLEEAIQMPKAVQDLIQDYSPVPDAAKRPVSFNGTLIDWEDATLQVASHVTHYGLGVFEEMRICHIKIRQRIQPKKMSTTMANRKDKNMHSQNLSTAPVLLSGSALAQAAMEKSLYERLGGYGAISAVVNDFANKLFTDPAGRALFQGNGYGHPEVFHPKEH